MKIIDNRNLVINNAIHFVNALNKPVYILGTNKYGLCTANWLKNLGHDIQGFINDDKPENTFEGYIIAKTKDLHDQDIAIINCIIEGRTIAAENNIIKMQPHSHRDYFALQLAFPNDLIEIDFLSETSRIAENTTNYNNLYDCLMDAESKKTLENLTNFRLNRDIKYLSDFEFKIKEQYFEPFMDLGKSPVFIDGGGFNGETSQTFARHYPHYEKIYYFEPNKISFEDSKTALAKFANVNFFENALWHQSETLFFDNSLGPASKLSQNGPLAIEAITLDSAVSTKVDFIKLDIEGAEYNALTGAKELIKKHRPKIAACVYHHQADFLRIPELLLALHPDYKVYLRHYTQGVFETVMYFI